MKVKWHNVLALAAIVMLILVLRHLGDSIGSFLETLIDDTRPRQRTPEQIAGAIAFLVLFITGMWGISVYLDMRNR